MSKTLTPSLLIIGDLALQTGASVRSIRHYDDQGLLASVRARGSLLLSGRLSISKNAAHG